MIALPVLAVALVLTRGCRETSDSEAVGLAHCRMFGDWSVSSGPELNLALTWGFGVETSIQDSVATDLCVTSGKSCTVVRTFDPGALGSPRLTVPMTALRLDAVRWGPFRAGLGIELATGEGVSSTALSTAGRLTLTQFSGLALGPSLGADVRWHRIGLTGDLMPALASVTSVAGEAVTFERSSQVAFIVRGGVRVWVTPAIAIEASAAVDLLDVQSRTAVLRLHIPFFYPFDGQDSLFD